MSSAPQHAHSFRPLSSSRAATQVDDDEVFDSKFLREYIAQARQKQPHVPHELTEYVVGAYVR